MKATYIITALFLMFGVLGLVGADFAEQNISATIEPDLSLQVFNSSIDFGTLKPGQTSLEVPVTLVPGNSNLSVSVNAEGDLFKNIQVSIDNWNFIGNPIFVKYSENKTFNLRLFVPAGWKSNTYSGKIIYTAMPGEI